MEEDEAPSGEGGACPAECGEAMGFAAAAMHASSVPDGVADDRDGEGEEEEDVHEEAFEAPSPGREGDQPAFSPGREQEEDEELLDDDEEPADAGFDRETQEDEEKVDFSADEHGPEDGKSSHGIRPLSGGEEERDDGEEEEETGSAADDGAGDDDAMSSSSHPERGRPSHDHGCDLEDDDGPAQGSSGLSHAPRASAASERVSAALADIATLCEPDSDEEGEISEDEVPFCRVTPQNPSFRSRALEFLNLPPNLTHLALQEALSRVGEVEEVVSSRFSSAGAHHSNAQDGTKGDSSRRRSGWIVRFRRAEDAAEVRKAFDGKVFGKSTVQVLFARDMPRNQKNRAGNQLSPDNAKRQLGKGGANAANGPNLRNRQSPPPPGAPGAGAGAPGPAGAAGLLPPGAGGPSPVGVAGMPAGAGVRSPLGPPPPFPPRPGVVGQGPGGAGVPPGPPGPPGARAGPPHVAGPGGVVGPPMGGPMPPNLVGGPLGRPPPGYGAGPMGIGGPPPPPPPPAPMMGRGGQPGPCCPPPPPPQQPGPSGVVEGRPGGGKAILRPRPDAGALKGRGEGDAAGAAQGASDTKVRLTPREEGPATGDQGGEDAKSDAAARSGARGRFAGPPGKVGVGGTTGPRERLTAEQRLECPVSLWKEKMTIEEQMNDYRELWRRFGYTNRYLLLSNIPQSLLSMEAMTEWLGKITGEMDFDLEFIPPLPAADKPDGGAEPKGAEAQGEDTEEGREADLSKGEEGAGDKADGRGGRDADMASPRSQAAEKGDSAGAEEDEADAHPQGDREGEGAQQGEEEQEAMEKEAGDRSPEHEEGYGGPEDGKEDAHATAEGSGRGMGDEDTKEEAPHSPNEGTVGVAREDAEEGEPARATGGAQEESPNHLDAADPTGPAGASGARGSTSGEDQENIAPEAAELADQGEKRQEQGEKTGEQDASGNAEAQIAEGESHQQGEAEASMATSAAGTEVVAHITYRTKKACMAAQKKLELNDLGIEIEPAGPRRPNSVLWLGNVREFMCKKPEQDRLRSLFEHFGEVVRFRLLAEKTCGFVHYRRTRDAVKARNHLYGLLVGREIYLNVDFSPLDPHAQHSAGGADGSSSAMGARRGNRHQRSRSPSPSSSRFRGGSSRRGQIAAAAGSNAGAGGGHFAGSHAPSAGDPRLVNLSPVSPPPHSMGGVHPPSPGSAGPGGAMGCRGPQFPGPRPLDGPPGPSAGGPAPSSIPPPPGCPWGGGGLGAQPSAKRPGPNAGGVQGGAGGAPFPPHHPLPPPPGSPYAMPANAAPGLLPPGGGPGGPGLIGPAGLRRKDGKGGMFVEGPGGGPLPPGLGAGRGRGPRGPNFAGNVAGGHMAGGDGQEGMMQGGWREGDKGRGRERSRKGERGVDDGEGSSSESDAGERGGRGGSKRRRGSSERARRQRKHEQRADKGGEESLLGLIRERLRERAAGSAGGGAFGRGPSDEEGAAGASQSHAAGRKGELSSASSDPLMDLLRGDPSLLDSMILDLAKERLKAELFSKEEAGAPSGAHTSRAGRDAAAKRGDAGFSSPDDQVGGRKGPGSKGDDRERHGPSLGSSEGGSEGARRRRSLERNEDEFLPFSHLRDGHDERGKGRPHMGGDRDEARRGGIRGRGYMLDSRQGRIGSGSYMNGESEEAMGHHGRERRNSRERERERPRGVMSALGDLPHAQGAGLEGPGGERGRGRGDRRGRNRYTHPGGGGAGSSPSRSRSRGSDVGERGGSGYYSSRFEEGLLGRGESDRHGALMDPRGGGGAGLAYHHHPAQGRRMGPGADGSYGMMTGMPGEPSRMRSGGAQSCARGPPLASERDRSPFPGPSSKRQRRYYDEYSYRGGERGVSNRGSSSPEPASSSMLRRDRRRSPPFYGGPAADRRGGGPGDHGMTALPPGGASRGGLGDGKPPLLDEDEREGGKGLGMRRDLSGGSPAGLDADGSPPAGPGRGRGSLSLERKRGDGRRSGCRGSIDQGEPTGKLGSGRREAGGGGDDDEDAGQLLMVCRVLKQGQRLCNMSAKFVGGDPNIRPPGVLDVNQRANLDRLQTHLRRGRQGVSSPHGGEGALRYSIWQLGADTRQDSRQYDELCDYFINKERVGLLESPSQAIYMVPPNPKYIKPLNLPDANFMYAYVIAK